MAEVPFPPDESRVEAERRVEGEETVGTRTLSNDVKKKSAAEVDEKVRAAVSLDSITFLFQVLMALALTNGAYIFVTGGSGGYALRPWNSYTLFGSLAFLTFVATLIPFAHANVLILKKAYMRGYDGKGLRPVTDFFLLFLEAGIFYALSHTLTQIDQDFFSFFYLAGAILGVDVIWALITSAFGTDRKGELLYVFLNSATLALGAVLILYNVTHLRELLLLTLGTRTVLDYALTYKELFPGAFRSQTKG